MVVESWHQYYDYDEVAVVVGQFETYLPSPQRLLTVGELDDDPHDSVGR